MDRPAITRRFKPNPKNREKVRKSPLLVAAISENRGSTDQNDIRKKAKRVKFTLPEPAQHPGTDVPKTSEYAFFKKLKEDIGGYYSRPLHKDDTNQWKTAKASDRCTETSTPSNIFKYADRKLRSSLQSEMERPIDQFSFNSQQIQAEPNIVSGLNSRDEFKGIRHGSSFPYANLVTPDGKNLVLSPFASVSNNSGNKYAGTGIFSVKRQKLCQLVANTFPEVGECSSKGFDLVSTLLRRLFPNDNENQCCHYSNSKGVLDTSEFEYASHWNDDLPEYWSSSPRQRVLSQWDITTSNIPLIEYNSETDFQDEEGNLNCSLDGIVMKSMLRDRDSSCYLSFDSNKSVSSGHLKELEGFHNPNEPAGREPQTLLLGWDLNEEKEQNLCSALVTSSDVAYQKILDDSLHAITMDNPSSLCSNYTLDFYSLPYAHSTGARWFDLGRNREDDYAVVATNQFPSFNPKYLTIAEDRDTCDLLEKNNVSLNCQDHPWFTSKDSGRKGHLEALLFSGGLNDDLGCKCFPFSEFSGEDYSSNSHIFHFPFKEDISSFALEESSLYRPKHRETTVTFSEEPFDIPSWFSANLHVSLDKLPGHSLLLDNPGRVRSEEEIHFDDGNQWKYS